MRTTVRRARAALLALLAASALAAPDALLAQPRGALRVPDGTATVFPGSRSSLAVPVLLENAGDSIGAIGLAVVSPGLRVTSLPAPALLAPGERRTVAVVLSLPPFAQAGDYLVALRATPSTTAADTLRLHVPARRVLAVTLAAQPRFVASGEPYEVRFLVRNLGNVAVAPQLVVRHSMNTPASPVGADRAPLAVGASREIRVAVSPRRVTALAGDVVTLEARGGTGDATLAVAEVTVAPRGAVGDDWERAPVRLALRTTDAHDPVAPFAASTSTRFGPRGDRALDVEIRGPSASQSPLGYRDLYVGELRTPTLRVLAGDRVLAPSGLVASSGTTTGILVERIAGARTGALFAAADRRTALGTREVGSTLRWAPAPRADTAAAGASSVEAVRAPFVLQASALARRGIDTGVVGGLSARWHRDGLRAEGELGASPSGDGGALMLRASHASPGATVDVLVTQAGRGFLGPLRGGTQRSLGASRALGRHLRASGSASSYSAGYGFGTELESRMRAASRNVSLAAFDRFVLGWRSSDGELRSQGGISPNASRTLSAQGTLPVGPLTVFGTVERGTTLLGAGSSEHRSATSRYVLGASGTVSGLAGGSLDAQLFESTSDVTLRTLSVGGSLHAVLPKSLRFTLQGSGNRLMSPGQPTYAHVEGALERRLGDGRSIALHVRRLVGAASALRPLVAYLEVGVPWRAPIARTPAEGRVFGELREASNGEPVAGALVRVGGQGAIADAQGRVAFRDLPAGEFRPVVELAGGEDHPVLDVQPVRVAMGALPSRFSARLTSAARVRGVVQRVETATAVRLAANAAAGSAPEGTGIANVIVMLIGARDTVHHVTDALGEFEVTGLAPGRWRVRIIPGDVPAFYKYEREEMEVDLLPGSSPRLAFLLVPKPRVLREAPVIQMLDAQEIGRRSRQDELER